MGKGPVAVADAAVLEATGSAGGTKAIGRWFERASGAPRRLGLNERARAQEKLTRHDPAITCLRECRIGGDR